MDYKKLIGFGLLFWIIIFVVWSMAVVLGIIEVVWVPYAIALISGVIGFVLARMTNANLKYSIVYALVWVFIALILDYFISTYFDPDMFSSWEIWAEYGCFALGVILGGLGKAKSKKSGSMPPGTPGAIVS